MDELDAAIEAARAELAALKAQPEQPSYGVGQLLYDIPVGVAKAGAGAADIVAYPFVKGLEYLGAPVEPWGTTKTLEAVSEQLAPSFGVRPETGAQELVSFLTPSPASKAKLLSQAGTGLVSYLGMKGAEAIAPESPYAGLVGALAAPATVAGVGKAVGAGTRLVSPAVGVAVGSEDALQAAAQAEILRQAGPEGIERLKALQDMPELAVGTGNVPLTAAEIVQTPGLAQYQQEIGKKLGATDILQAAKEQRGIELKAALNRFGVDTETGDFALALRDAAEEAVKKKAASEGNILQSLGLTEEGKAVSKLERGATLREAINTRLEQADDLVSGAWSAVPKSTKLDLTGALNETLREYAQFGELAKADVSGKAQRVMDKVREIVQAKNGVATVGELQDLRSAAGRAMAEASGVNKTQAALMATLRDNIDNFGISYFYDPAVGIKGGLPGTAATAPDLEALQKLSKAVDLTRELKQTFNTGVVGEITATRRFQPRLQTSKVIDRALASPENAQDIINKFGRTSVEVTEMRMEMLARLDKATNPTDFLGRNKDTLKALFDTDYEALNKFAQQKGRGTGLEQFERITESKIPNKVFADVRQADAFMKQFQGTELEQYARAKFINTNLTKTGNAVANLEANKKIAQRLFAADYDDLQKVLTDLELAKSPAELAKAASKGQAITSQSLTTLGAIAASRGVIATMKQQGPTSGGIIGALTGGGIGGLIGAGTGAAISKAGQSRELQLDTIVARMLANPRLMKLAAAAPTETNINRFLELSQTLQRGGIAAAPETTEQFSVQPTEEGNTAVNIDAAIEEAQRELEMLRAETNTESPKPTVEIGRQKINIPTGENYASPDLVKAVIRAESAGNPKAVSEKGAGGLMQLMAGTARDLGLTPKQRFDPVKNVEAGSRYLQQQIEKFGSIEAALAAYNWGPRNIAKAKAKLESEGLPVTWENIKKAVKVPGETKAYVNTVLKYLEA
jgi:hypothetical protein